MVCISLAMHDDDVFTLAGHGSFSHLVVRIS
jgi:hypothetical protein